MVFSRYLDYKLIDRIKKLGGRKFMIYDFRLAICNSQWTQCPL